MANSKARNLADLLSTGNLTVPSSSSLALTTGDSGVTVVDTGTDGQVQINVDNVVAMKIHEHSMEIPKGTTAQRSTVASVGELRYNTDTGYFESYTTSGWGSIATPPSILDITPDTFSGEAGTEFTITGSFFDAQSTVKIVGSNGTEYTPATTTYISSGELRITTATDLLVDNEPYKVKVTNGAGLSVESVQTIDAGTVPAFITTAGVVHETATYDEVISGVFIQASDAETSVVGYEITSGALPNGLTLNSTTGEISGTADPQATTTYNFTVTATDTVGNTNSRDFSVRIVNGAPVWSYPAENESFEVGISSSITPISLNATDPEGNAVTYSINGSLPSGLTFSNGVLQGNPSVEGNTAVTATASDGFTSTSRTFYINVLNPGTALIGQSFTFISEYDDWARVNGYPLSSLMSSTSTTSQSSWADVNAYMSLSSVTDGYQQFVAPYTGTYRFTVAGARGGAANGYNSPGNYQSGGYGRVIIADVELTQGQTYTVVVGHRGGTYNGSQCGGGGGGSFLFSGTKSGNALTTLIAAGGGGGGGSEVYSSSASDLIQANGQPVTSNGQGGGWGGGINGYGGSAGSGSEDGASGAGVFGPGYGDSTVVDPNGAIIVGTGVGSVGPYSNANYGSFAGGVAGWGSGGGGGGYSGGGAKVNVNGNNRVMAGGGGSYIGSGVTLISDSGLNYNNSYFDNGYVTINFIG